MSMFMDSIRKSGIEIKLRLSVWNSDDDDDDDVEESYSKNNSGMCFYRHICSSDGTQSTPVSPWKSKPSIGEQTIGGSSTERLVDLRRRHTICNPTMRDEHGATLITFPFEYTNSTKKFDSFNGPAISPIMHRRKAQQQLPRSMSNSLLQEELFQSNQWQTAMECLSLNLEEVVHIRYVLTKAELEALPVDCSLKGDVENGKICFLCLKTRFGLLTWGNQCKLCKRTVCAKCCSKMRIPTEHFSKVPVSSLSPALSPRDEEKELPGSRAPTPNNSSSCSNIKRTGRKNSVGSAPTSPNMSRKSIGTDSDSGQRSISPGLLESEERDRFSPDHGNGHHSLPTVTSISLGLMAFKRRNFGRGKDDDKTEKLKGSLMVVCHDCKAMVLQIIRSSRAKKASNYRNQLDLERCTVQPVA
ncbi:Protein spire [Orchesella cincta]|uniref:Protein spire n=1 Tax=Orchesella cincta TaxID=48709 RepID=A0A1D2NG61_ORCCI|nr:Protein spire [Orchesella cincta]